MIATKGWIPLCILAILLFAVHTHAFGAGNIASISTIEGKNWRHGDIEDLLKQVACIKHHKWSSMMIKRVYFGNWLRDYSQAMDTGALKKAPAETIRILVWLLSFLGFGYATAEFEVTSARLGVYRPEEHIDNPKNYNDDQDARPYDPRLRAPVRPVELEIDHETGMKNYIANGKGDWATSAAFVKHSFTQSIVHGRAYTQGGHGFSKGEDDDLAEALRLLGQGLHTLEDFGAHTNYVELALIELGHRDVFAHVGQSTQINLRGKRVWPLVTGTFGMVDFYHSVLGEATDHFTQSEVNEMDNAMGVAEQAATSSNPLSTLVGLLSKVPGTGGLVSEAQQLQASSQAARRELNFGGSGSRGIDDVTAYGSSRGVDDFHGSLTRDPGGFPGANYGGGQQYQSNVQQSYQGPGYNQGGYPQGGYTQAGNQYGGNSSLGQHQGGYQQYDNHNMNPNYNQPSAQPYNQSGGYGSYNQSSDQNYGGNTYPQSQPQYQQPSWQSGPQHTYQSQIPSNSFQPSVYGTQADTTNTSQTGVFRPPQGLEGMPNFDPAKTAKQIYPILAFRDKCVRTLSAIIEKIPGLEALVDRITETLTIFIFSLLAPFVRPVLNALEKTLRSSSEGVTEWNKKHQYEVWEDSRCSDPTHSMLSKDHFSNILNEPAGKVAGEILKYIAPRVLYAWEHPDVPVDRVMRDVDSIFHHPAVRDERNDCHRNMFEVVKRWAQNERGFEQKLNASAVRSGKNHIAGINDHAGHGSSMAAGGAAPQATMGSTLQGAGNILGTLTGHPIPQHHDQSNQGGLGGLLHQAESLIGGSTNQHHNQNQSGLGQVFQQAESFLGGSQSHHSTGHSSNNPLGDMLSLANHLPGVGKYTSQLDKFNKVSSMLGGRRELPADGNESYSRGVDDDTDQFTRQADQYRGLGLTKVGGSDELMESALRGSQGQGMRAPSPGGLRAPRGYEEYEYR